MNEDQKRTIVTIAMVVCVIILGFFVYEELSNQRALIELLDECDYDHICDVCISERIYGVPAVTNDSPQFPAVIRN